MKSSLIFLIMTFSAFGAASGKILPKGLTMSSWFSSHDFVRIEIQKTGKKPFSSEDKNAIKTMISRIERIPADGDKMKSLSPETEVVTLTFFSTTRPQTTEIKIYDGHFKTPSTGFNRDYQESEKDLFTDIEALLAPTFKQKLLKIIGCSVENDDVKITFMGNEYEKNDGPGMPTIGPTNEDRFEVLDKKGKTQVVKIFSGQVPPQPASVKIGSKVYTINTMKSSKGERLYNAYFEVEERAL